MNYWEEVLQRLDLNAKGAWLIYIGGTLLFLASLWFKRRITWREWYITFGVVGFMAWMGDIIFFFFSWTCSIRAIHPLAEFPTS